MPVAITPTDARRHAALAIALYLAFGLLLPFVPIPPLHTLAMPTRIALLVVPTAMFMLLQLWLAWSLVRLAPGTSRALGLTAIAVLLWFITFLFVHPVLSRQANVNFALAMLRPALLGFWITLAGTFGGIGLSRIVRERNVILPVALVAMPIDYLGAMTNIGFTQNAVAQHPQIVSAVSVPVPIIHGLHIQALIGPGDALFIAFFFAAIRRLEMNGRGTFWLMYGLLTLTMLLVLFFDFPIAALVPMGLAVIFANRRFFTLKREEYFAMFYAGALVIALVAGFYVFSHSLFFVPKETPFMTPLTLETPRRVLLLETDERAGLVAALAAACAAEAVSLEIVTGPGHVLLTFTADEPTLARLAPALRAVGGVLGLHPYTVAHA